MPRAPAALGFSVHTGWAALVAVVAAEGAPAVVERSRLEILGSDPERPRFVFHAARERPAAEAGSFVRELTALAHARAAEALRAAVEALAGRGLEVARCGLLAGKAMPSIPLAAILASHALVHAAEGALFRDAVRAAGETLGLPGVEVGAKELPSRGAAVLGVTPATLMHALAAVGRAAGRPWAKDQRDAYLLAAVALASGGSAGA